MKTIRWFNPSTEFYTDERCYIIELSNEQDAPACSIARARVQPGVITQRHSLRGIAERYVILEGAGIVEIGDESPTEGTPLDVVHIAPGTSQRISNTGKTDLVFLSVCTPRFIPDAYVNLET